MTKNDLLTDASVATSLNRNDSKILFISGSNSIKSINLQLVSILAKSMQQNQTRLIDLNDFPMPMYSDSEEAKGIPAMTLELLKIINDYNVLVVAVPEHNHSVPAFFKNAIDWLSRTSGNYQSFGGKEIILLNASPGNAGNHTLINASEILQMLGANILGTALLKQFYKNTNNITGLPEITNNDFLSQFESLVAMSKAGKSTKITLTNTFKN